MYMMFQILPTLTSLLVSSSHVSSSILSSNFSPRVFAQAGVERAEICRWNSRTYTADLLPFLKEINVKKLSFCNNV